MCDDYCVECGAYGDDYYYDEDTGEYLRACDNCIFNPMRGEEDE